MLLVSWLVVISMVDIERYWIVIVGAMVAIDVIIVNATLMYRELTVKVNLNGVITILVPGGRLVAKP